MRYVLLTLTILSSLAAVAPASADININNRSGQCVVVCVPSGNATVCVPVC
jgi:hypothetical protein